QLTFLTMSRQANEAFVAVLDKFKISPDDLRPSGSLPKLITSPKAEKSTPREIQAAEVAITNALARKPNDAQLNHQLGTVYFFARNMDEAEKFYRKALALDETNAKIYNDLALIDVNRKDLDQALARLTRALHLDPGLLEAQYNLGVVFELRGETSNAINAWSKYLEMDKRSDSDWVAIAREHLNELRR
ncbi:MAG: tetratricopeptide repeat protein, partial [bacterium]